MENNSKKEINLQTIKTPVVRGVNEPILFSSLLDAYFS